MILFCFKTKEGLYREVLRRRLAEARRQVLSQPDEGFATSLVRGYEPTCDNRTGIRMLEWAAESRKHYPLEARGELASM